MEIKLEIGDIYKLTQLQKNNMQDVVHNIDLPMYYTLLVIYDAIIGVDSEDQACRILDNSGSYLSNNIIRVRSKIFLNQDDYWASEKLSPL